METDWSGAKECGALSMVMVGEVDRVEGSESGDLEDLF